MIFIREPILLSQARILLVSPCLSRQKVKKTRERSTAEVIHIKNANTPVKGTIKASGNEYENNNQGKATIVSFSSQFIL